MTVAELSQLIIEHSSGCARTALARHLQERPPCPGTWARCSGWGHVASCVLRPAHPTPKNTRLGECSSVEQLSSPTSRACGACVCQAFNIQASSCMAEGPMASTRSASSIVVFAISAGASAPSISLLNSVNAATSAEPGPLLASQGRLEF